MTISNQLRERVRKEAQNRCGYCRSPQEIVYGLLEIEHIFPETLDGTDDEENLWLACRMCNNHKGEQTHAQDPISGRTVRLFNPRRQAWKRHFQWSPDGAKVIGRTACGRATVMALKLNNSIAVSVRQRWVSAGWHPPQE